MRIVYLSQKFFDEYKNCPEILTKIDRPYACIEIKIGDLVFAIPFRHHIAHKYAFFTIEGCGLDFTKAVVIPDQSYIGAGTPQINSTEFQAIKGKDEAIRKQLIRYIKLYIKATQNYNNPFYDNIRKYSTLQYFDNWLSNFTKDHS